MEEIVNRILKKLHNLEYSESFIDSTIFTNKKGIEIHAITVQELFIQ